MKRSEMISYLHNLINTFPGGSQFDRAAVDELLKGLEHKGMLPPRVRVEEVRKSQFMPDGETGMFVSWTYKSVWEPEDEKK